jgi:hypothetical protein
MFPWRLPDIRLAGNTDSARSSLMADSSRVDWRGDVHRVGRIRTIARKTEHSPNKGIRPTSDRKTTIVCLACPASRKS